MKAEHDERCRNPSSCGLLAGGMHRQFTGRKTLYARGSTQPGTHSRGRVRTLRQAAVGSDWYAARYAQNSRARAARASGRSGKQRNSAEAESNRGAGQRAERNSASRILTSVPAIACAGLSFPRCPRMSPPPNSIGLPCKRFAVLRPCLRPLRARAQACCPSEGAGRCKASLQVRSSQPGSRQISLAESRLAKGAGNAQDNAQAEPLAPARFQGAPETWQTRPSALRNAIHG